MNQNKLNEEVVRLVRKHINENGLLEGQENEPREPFPQDCCGQSCKPCVFDIHFDDVVRWAKEYSKYIISGDRTLYEQFFEKKELSEDSKIWFFSQYRSLEISDLKNLNSHTVLVRFRTPQPVVLPISSHIRIRIRHGDKFISRQYTPTSLEDDHFEIPIKIYPDGEFSSKVRKWQVGDMIECRGSCSEDHEWHKASHLLIAAAGTGIAPFVRILNHLLNDPPKSIVQRIRLLYCVRTVEDAILIEYLSEWAQSWNVKIFLVLSSQLADQPAPKDLPYLVKFEAGRINQELFEQHLEQLCSETDNISVAVCGPTTFEKDVINFAKKANVQKILRFFS